MQVTVAVAKARLSKLIDATLSGEEVVIARRGRPVAKLVPIPHRKFRIGLLSDQLSGPVPDFFEPLDENDLSAWEGGR
ncbi:type II toxin-antitoxin system Phd/YefM family antitoxin [Mycobacterium sp. KBS0706]|uniref:type II toxin-antitoxin system Phd/YefM family antitoxin n=1 Tax=Mycobacterium sp. KBS0706 TaxID=2578109 RepID=UPI00110F860D|nr:type II toxin-antitoxin system prevent-host-death family antitoxin [Mycobacterium sp. KBS0706]TSD88906.1 type II toxin-antitoxin system Phd/YefM family antitoxin [Mycobacterium sp. KBS0706]